MGRARAFTLIEIMICIALLSIFLSIAVHRADTGGWLSQEADYRFALRNARLQLEELRAAPFDSLPPQQVKVGREGWVQLAHGQLVPGSVRCQSEIKSVDSDRGRVQLKTAAGQTVTVDYAYYVGDRGEAHTIPNSPPFRITLRNSPVLKVESVHAYRGGQSRSVSCRQFGDQLEFSAELGGQVVSVDYAGARVRNQVSGVFLDDRLGLSSKPQNTRLLYVKEAYGQQGTTQMQLSLVKSQ